MRGGRALAGAGRRDESRTTCARWSTRAVATFGRLDVMICNAGIGFHGSLAESTPEIARRLFDVNVLGTFYAAQAAHDQFARQGSGHIIAMSSVAGIRGGAGMSLYSATKAAQIAFIESLRTEFIGTGLHASVVYPGLGADGIPRRDATRLRPRRPTAAAPHQSVEHVADAVARCIDSPRAEVYPHRPAALAGRGRGDRARRGPIGSCGGSIGGERPLESEADRERRHAADTAARDRRGRPRTRRPRAARRRLRARRTARPRAEGPRRRGLRRPGRRAARAARAVRPRRHRRRELRGLQDRAASTSRCPAANRRPAAATRDSRSRAIPTCRSTTPRGGATSRSTRSRAIR